MADKAIITSLSITELPEANTLNKGFALGYSILVGKDTKDGELGILFEDGLQLSEEFAKANDLIRRKLPDGTMAGGYFEENRRVRAKKFMKVHRSEAFWCPLSYLSFTGYDLTKLKQGDLIEELNGIPICNKYYTKATLSKRNGPSRKERRGATKWFLKHFDTAQFRHFADKIPVGATCIITEKMHGTSQRIGHCLDEVNLKWYHKLLMKLGMPIRLHDYKYMLGTRNVLIDGVKEGYHSNEFRERAAKPFYGKLHKGEVVYYEVLGWEKENTPIMERVSPKGLKDKAVEKKYGDSIVYTYGCPNGELDIYVYRICSVNEDGRVIEYPWEYVKARCGEMGIKHVPEIEKFEFDGNVETLRDKVAALTEVHHDKWPHPTEGVCLRYEKGLDFQILKNKSFLFKLLEGIVRESEDYVDTEEIS